MHAEYSAVLGWLSATGRLGAALFGAGRDLVVRQDLDILLHLRLGEINGAALSL